MTYTSNIPQANDNPSNSQGPILNNFGAINTWVQVDHVGFNDSGHSGKHNQVTYDTCNVPGAQTEPSSTSYTNNDSAIVTSAHANLFYTNVDGVFATSCIRAFAYINGTSTPPVVIGKSSNVASVVRNSTGNYTVTLTANAVPDANALVFITCNDNARTLGTYYNSMNPSGTFSTVVDTWETDNNSAKNTYFSFLVIQI